MMAGEFQVADGASKELAERAASEPDAAMAAGFVSMQALVLLRFARWDSVLNLPDPGEKSLVARVYWQFARSCALAAKGRSGEAAEAAQQSMEATFAKFRPGRNSICLPEDGAISTRSRMKCCSRALRPRSMKTSKPWKTGGRR